jgi:hypothetical protein
MPLDDLLEQSSLPHVDVDVDRALQRAERSHRRHRRARLAAGAVVTVLAACVVGVVAVSATRNTVDTESPGVVVESPGPAALAPGWNRLPDPPLSPRNGAVAAWTGNEVVVFGGWENLCPPGADCATVPTPFDDGAAYNPATRTWRPIAQVPAPIASRTAVALNGDVYVLGCLPASCNSDALLRYRPGADTWDTLSLLPSNGAYALLAAEHDVIAYRGSDEAAELPDYRFDTAAQGWEALPDDPFPAMYDRQLLWNGDELLLFGKRSDANAPPPPIEVARLRGDNTWEALPQAPGSAFQAWALDGEVIVNPHFGAPGGGIFDPPTNAWSPLPDPPASFGGDMAGALGRDRAVYEYAAGWVLDVPTRRWIEIPDLDAREDASGVAKTAVGRDLFIFGGDRWDDDNTNGTLLNDAWMWVAHT